MSGIDLTGLADLWLLQGLPKPALERVLTYAEIKRYAPESRICEEGRPATHVHVLLSGIVDLVKIEGRRECGILMLTSGDICMPVAALFGEPYLTSARALTVARVLQLPIGAVRQEAELDPAFALRLVGVIGGHWRMAVRHILDLKCRGAPERLAAFLLRLVDESTTPQYVDLPFPKRHLAARVGMTAETLSRALQVLADNGLHLRGSRILVRDREKIDAFCGPDPYPERTDSKLHVHVL